MIYYWTDAWLYGIYLLIVPSSLAEAAMICLCWIFFCNFSVLFGSRDNRDKNVTNLPIWQMKTVVLHALHERYSFLYISPPFLSYQRREMICFAVVWTTNFHFFSFPPWTAHINCNLTVVSTNFYGGSSVTCEFLSLQIMNLRSQLINLRWKNSYVPL